MQFRGALRSPGDRGPGVPVVLVVDEYHLEILRGKDLIGRWYLADVEVVRDIAERFVLFLGDDEMEFLAEDALQFAYDGVTAMQNAWLRAQKKKRRHRKAAADSARRKDETPAVVDANLDLAAEKADRPPRQTRPAATSELARRLAASPATHTAGTKVPQPRRTGDEAAEAELVPETPPVGTSRIASTGKQSLSARRKEVASAADREPTRVEPEPSPISKRLTRAKTEPTPVEPEPVESPLTAPPWIAPEPASREPAVRAEPIRPRGRRLGEQDKVPVEEIGKETDGTSIHVPLEPAAPAPTIRQRRARKEPASPPPERDRTNRRGRRLLPTSNGAARPLTEERPGADEPEQVDVPDDVEVRFAPEGHHPSETSTGIFSKLRKQPKLPDDHVHKFEETGSSVGLVRRVCIECSYVSIGNDDERSAITRW